MGRVFIDCVENMLTVNENMRWGFLDGFLCCNRHWKSLQKFWSNSLSMCNWSPGWILWPNYEVLELQPWSGTTTVLDRLCHLLLCTFLTRLLCLYIRLPVPGLYSCPHRPILLRLNISLTLHPHGFLCSPGYPPSPFRRLQSPHGFILPPGRIERNYPFSITTNNGNLPLPFFGGNYPILLLDNIY